MSVEKTKPLKPTEFTKKARKYIPADSILDDFDEGDFRKLEELLLEACEIIDHQTNKIEQIKDWAYAYPLNIFPKPDLKKAASVLEENGITLDSISADAMRYVLDGVLEILDDEKTV
jgi:hypothetical protein